MTLSHSRALARAALAQVRTWGRYRQGGGSWGSVLISISGWISQIWNKANKGWKGFVLGIFNPYWVALLALTTCRGESTDQSFDSVYTVSKRICVIFPPSQVEPVANASCMPFIDIKNVLIDIATIDINLHASVCQFRQISLAHRQLETDRTLHHLPGPDYRATRVLVEKFAYFCPLNWTGSFWKHTHTHNSSAVLRRCASGIFPYNGSRVILPDCGRISMGEIGVNYICTFVYLKMGLGLIDGVLGRDCGHRGGVGSLLGHDKPRLHQYGLSNIDSDLDEGSSSQYARTDGNDSIRAGAFCFNLERRTREVAVCGLLLILGCCVGFWRIDRGNRYYYRWLIIGVGYLLFCGSLWLLVQSDNSRTWGWSL